ncbi:MAG: hypothetical protein VYA84_02000 [Planctomycetota bacterium]|nr:hypothetical protein [Planctomycetota bacterium]
MHEAQDLAPAVFEQLLEPQSVTEEMNHLYTLKLVPWQMSQRCGSHSKVMKSASNRH